MKLFDKTWKLALSGVVIGLLVMLLAMSGNPANMAICVACFIRDAAGALKLHTAAPVQYFRPEIVGFVCGSFLISMATKEYRSTAGSAPMVRFLLGAVMMIGALVFLGCPLRMVLRMSAGDLNAYVALIGFAGGVATGSCFLKKGFSLGRAYETKSLSGAVLPVLLAALLVIGVATGYTCLNQLLPLVFLARQSLCRGLCFSISEPHFSTVWPKIRTQSQRHVLPARSIHESICGRPLPPLVKAACLSLRNSVPFQPRTFPFQFQEWRTFSYTPDSHDMPPISRTQAPGYRQNPGWLPPHSVHSQSSYQYAGRILP